MRGSWDKFVGPGATSAEEWLQLIAGIILGWKFLGASDALAATKAGIGAETCLIVAVQLLVGLAPRMHAERLKREIKRTQIMVLADRQGA